jgi:hypothetical protein
MAQEIISKFNEKPKTKMAWRAMYFGLATLLIPQFLGIFAAVIRPMIDRASVNNENVGRTIGFGFGILALILSISALITGICAFRKGERSWVLWVGFVPAILIGAFWVFMIIGEFVFPH